ncbi:MAG: hypothetical protein JW706_08965 [Opitutales bacterium]|nr:hypothetical protein [Opitutales bacterium]
MAKVKLTINDIQKALLSGTKYIKETEVEPAEAPEETQEENESAPDNQILIDPVVFKKLSILAHYSQEEVEDMIHNALVHFLRVKSYQLERAIQQMAKEEATREAAEKAAQN